MIEAERIRRLGGAVLLAMLVSACASTPTAEEEQPEAGQPQPTVEDVLTRAPSRQEYTTADRCLRRSDYDKVEVLADGFVAFHERNGRSWVNKLTKRCNGLRPGLILNFAVLRGRICAGGMFEGWTLSPDGRQEQVTSHCLLGVFQRATREQADALKATLRRR